jgi:uncharacterized protein YifN (PemK superfamily)
MPHAFRLFRCMRRLGFTDDQAMAVGSVVELARQPEAQFRREQILDQLHDAGFSEAAGHAFCSVLRNCFVSEKVATWFNRSGLKTRLVRAGVQAPFADALLDDIKPCVVTRHTPEVRKPIAHVPGPGKVVMCDFTFLTKPEMQKERRAVVVSSRSAHMQGRCLVVPVSKSLPKSADAPYHEFAPGSYPFFHPTEPVWAVCDHVYTVSLTRLWMINLRHRPQLPAVSGDDLRAIRALLGTILALDH